MQIKWGESVERLLSTRWDEPKGNAPNGWWGRLRCLIPWAFLVGSYVRIVLYMARNWVHLLNSDMAAEMMLAQQLNANGGFLSPAWYYSTELRVVNTQFAYRLGLGLFPDNWHLARVFSIAVLLLVLVLCCLFFFKVIGFGRSRVWITALLLCPFSHWYAINILLGCYYITYVAFSLISVALVLLYCRTERPLTRRLYLGGLGVVAFAACLGGIRQLQICYVPAVAASLLWDMTLLWPDSKHFSRADGTGSKTFTLRHNVATFTALFCGGVGYFVNRAVLAKQYFFSSFGNVVWREFSLERAAYVFSDFLASFGFMSEARAVSLRGIAGLMGLVLGVLVVAASLRLLLRGSALPLETVFLTDVFVAMLVVNVIALSQLETTYHMSYFVPLLPFGLLVLLLEIRQDMALPLGRSLALLFLCGSVLCSSYFLLREPTGFVDYSDAQLSVAADWLVDNGYTQGYAGFWQADAMVEYSNGKLELWTVEEDETLQISKWLQPVAHSDTAPTGNVFLLLSRRNADAMPALWERMKAGEFDLLYDDGVYVILSVDPAELITG